MRHYYYAAQYPCGVGSVSYNNGPARLLRDIYQFEDRASRDEFVAARTTDQRYNNNYREAIPAARVTRHERARIAFVSDAHGYPIL